MSVNNIFDTPIFSAILYVDKSLMINKSSFKVILKGPYIHSDNAGSMYYYSFLFDDEFRGIRLKIENVDSNTTGSFFQSQTFNDTNSTECVAGSRTLVMVRVNVYAVSITGSFGLSLRATKLRSPVQSSANASGTVDSGECSYMQHL